MIKRIAETELLALASQYKAVAVTGPRHSGKTTLVRMVFKNKHIFIYDRFCFIV
jgi:predicted AAA+ superfamily ATPase